MRLKKGLIRHQVLDDSMWIATGSLSEKFRGMVRGNETAGFLLEHMQNETTEQELVDALLAEYEVEREQAARDVEKLVHMLREEGLLE